MVRLCGAALGFFAFSITILLGLAAGNTVEFILQRALSAMLVFWAFGMCVGWIACKVLDEHALGMSARLFSDEVGDAKTVEPGSPEASDHLAEAALENKSEAA